MSLSQLHQSFLLFGIINSFGPLSEARWFGLGPTNKFPVEQCVRVENKHAQIRRSAEIRRSVEISHLTGTAAVTLACVSKMREFPTLVDV